MRTVPLNVPQNAEYATYWGGWGGGGLGGGWGGWGVGEVGWVGWLGWVGGEGVTVTFALLFRTPTPRLFHFTVDEYRQVQSSIYIYIYICIYYNIRHRARTAVACLGHMPYSVIHI